VLLCPAVGGTFGIIALEAMAAGCAVVAADTPGFRNVVRDGVDGLLVEVNPAADPRSLRLADAANRLLTDEAARRRLVEAGRRRATAFDWKEITARVLALYARLRGEATPTHLPARARSA
jgi:glycosyltransferase involved in cell wall biosynthesis